MMDACKRQRGRPPVPLFRGVRTTAVEKKVARLAKQYCRENDRGEHVYVVKKVKMGKALFWALVYAVYVNRGKFVRGDNVLAYHNLLTRCVENADLLAPRNKISEHVAKLNTILMALKDRKYATELTGTAQHMYAKAVLKYEKVDEVV